MYYLWFCLWHISYSVSSSECEGGIEEVDVISEESDVEELVERKPAIIHYVPSKKRYVCD